MSPEKNQLDKFKTAATEAECDLDEAGFDEALKGLVTSPKTKEKPEEED